MKPDNKTSGTETTGLPGEKLEQQVPAAPTAPAEAPAPGTKTAAEWAKAKGMFHEFTEGKRGPKARPKSQAPLIHNPAFARFHRARHSNDWPMNMELTEAQFDDAVKTADGHVYR